MIGELMTDEDVEEEVGETRVIIITVARSNVYISYHQIVNVVTPFLTVLTSLTSSVWHAITRSREKIELIINRETYHLSYRERRTLQT